MSIKLYDLVGRDRSRPFSPHCWKTKMACAHLGLEVETIPTRFTEIQNAAGGGFKTLPIIDDGGKAMSDSFEIAKYLASKSDQNAQALFGGAAGEALVRFVESWSQSQLHSWIAQWAMLDIHNILHAPDQAYFRKARESLFGMTLEKFTEDREESIPDLIKRLLPMRMLLKHHDFIGGNNPNFADYIVFGAFQWLRISSSLQMLPQDHPVADWFKRCMDLHDGLGHTVSEGELTL